MSDWLVVEGRDGRYRRKYWPMCPIPQCPNRICLALDSKYCWPHTPGGSFADMMTHLNNETEKQT